MLSRRTLLKSLPLTAAAVAVSPAAAQATPPTPSPATAVANAVRFFSADLYRALAAGRTGANLVFAPYSIVNALAMTRAGARRATAAEMDTVLHAPAPVPRTLDQGMQAIELALAGHRTGDGVERPLLSTANAVWTRLGLTLKPAYRSTLADYYGATTHPVDFRNASEAARQEINAWVSARTNAKIPELLALGTVDPDTNLVLTNATYLRAAWAWPFTAAATAPAPFTRDDGQVVTAQMMRGPFDTMGYAEGTGYRAVNVPYKNSTLAMAVVLPTAGTLADLESRLTGLLLGDLLSRFTTATVQLRLPKWTFRVPASLRGLLSGLGMPTAFTDRADFSGISCDQQRLVVDDVVHETFIGVDEKGTEAAAATGVIFKPPSVPSGPSFFADRPFLFVIHDKPTGVPLFIGRVLDPTAV